MKHSNDGYLGDELIISLYNGRDERAIRETDAKYRAKLLAVAHSVLGNAQDAEECLNDTYMRVWNSIPPAHPDSLRAYLISVVRRTAFNRYKAGKRQKRVPSDMVSSLSDLDGMLADSDAFYTEQKANDLGELLTDFTNTLSDRRAFIFMNRYYFCRPIADIARKLGCSESTVHKEIAAIKQELRQILESEGYLK